jgi:hypothetical protein
MHRMLRLDDPLWPTLETAYGDAAGVPSLLARLASLPAAAGDAEPWFSLWSALAHQGEVYSASFAAVPHVVAAMAIDPTRASADYLHFPAWVEICRRRNGAALPADLAPAYTEALARLPGLVAAAAARPWDEDFTACALAALAAAKGHDAIARAALELSDDTAQEFLAWLDER